MGKYSNLVGQGLLVGSLAWALMLPTAAIADTPVYDTTTTTTTTTMQAPAGGYYDSYGVWHTGATPFAGGWYDSSGVWHGGEVSLNTTYQVTYHHDMYNQDVYNYYAGYGSMYDINRGYCYVMGPDGLKHEVDLNSNRTFVRLSDDNTLEPKLDVARGFDRGLVDVPMSSFDPMRLSIPTGRTVTFYADNGAHTIQPMDGQSMNQSVIITPGQVFSFTFTQPGLYRFEDSFGGGPTGDHIHGLIINVHGDPVAWDDSAFCDADVVAIHTETAESTAVVTPPVTTTTQETTVVPQQTTQTQTVQVQGQTTQAPTKKVHKTILRNQDVK